MTSPVISGEKCSLLIPDSRNLVTACVLWPIAYVAQLSKKGKIAEVAKLVKRTVIAPRIEQDTKVPVSETR